MDTRTGEIFFCEENELESLLGRCEDLISIDEKDMTNKQKKERKVNLHDRRSKLGKQRLTALQERKEVFGK